LSNVRKRRRRTRSNLLYGASSSSVMFLTTSFKQDTLSFLHKNFLDGDKLVIASNILTAVYVMMDLISCGGDVYVEFFIASFVQKLAFASEKETIQSL